MSDITNNQQNSGDAVDIYTAIPAGMIRAAYAFLEDKNYHTESAALQAALPWAFPAETRSE